MGVSHWFRGDFIGGVRSGFPYPEKICPYCNKKCRLMDAIHVQDEMELFKALYICHNPQCEVYDEPARKAYAKVYYSNDDALTKLELARILYNRKKI